MTREKALINALVYYKVANTGSPFDIDIKLKYADECLDFLQNGGIATNEWIKEKYTILSRVVRLQRQNLKTKKDGFLYEDELAELREENRKLYEVQQLFKNLPELPF